MIHIILIFIGAFIAGLSLGAILSASQAGDRESVRVWVIVMGFALAMSIAAAVITSLTVLHYV